MTDEAFMILNMADNEHWVAGFGHAVQLIPEVRRPTVLQTDRSTAEAEVLRLAKAHPESRFVLFEASCMAVAIDAPTHVSLSGKPLLKDRVVRLATIGDGIPF